MDYNDFISKIKLFQQSVQQKKFEPNEDYSQILFSSTYRKIFAIFNQSSKKIKLSIEVHATIPPKSHKTMDQQFFTNQLQTMIELFTYLLHLQQNSFIIDVLSEEAFWYASIEVTSSIMDEQVVELLNLNEEVL